MPGTLGSGKQEPAFIRIVDGGALEWGIPNPTQGGGMEVYSVTRQDNGQLTGTKELRGFEVKIPDGFDLPIMHVTLTPQDGGAADASPPGAL